MFNAPKKEKNRARGGSKKERVKCTKCFPCFHEREKKKKE
jgi:hypothetical protein